MRTHLVLPDDLVKQVDATVGKRKRSRFVEEAVREKLRRQTLLAAISKTAGMLSTEDHPQWTTSEQSAAWVRESRRRDNYRLEKLARA
jgi:metal-responsive CopG/Arc/MetJ family transcriptional regulator